MYLNYINTWMYYNDSRRFKDCESIGYSFEMNTAWEGIPGFMRFLTTGG